jgi:60Kd inner membrane protein/RDD family
VLGLGSELEVASLPRRFAASLLNVLVGILALVLTIGAGAGVLAAMRRRRVSFGFLRGLTSGGANIPVRLQSQPLKGILHVAAFSLPLLTKKRRSPGFRVLGLWLVDARTGESASRRQEIIRAATRQTWQILCRRLVPIPTTQASAEHEKLRSEIELARRRYAEDQQALQREVMRIYREKKVEPVRASCLPVLWRLPLITAIDLPFWSSRKQSLLDRLAGTVIVRDRPSQHRR